MEHGVRESWSVRHDHQMVWSSEVAWFPLYCFVGATGQDLLFLADYTGTLLEAWMMKPCYCDIFALLHPKGKRFQQISSANHVKCLSFAQIARFVCLMYIVDPLPAHTWLYLRV